MFRCFNLEGKTKPKQWSANTFKSGRLMNWTVLSAVYKMNQNICYTYLPIVLPNQYSFCGVISVNALLSGNSERLIILCLLCHIFLYRCKWPLNSHVHICAISEAFTADQGDIGAHIQLRRAYFTNTQKALFRCLSHTFVPCFAQ